LILSIYNLVIASLLQEATELGESELIEAYYATVVESVRRRHHVVVVIVHGPHLRVGVVGRGFGRELLVRVQMLLLLWIKVAYVFVVVDGCVSRQMEQILTGLGRAWDHEAFSAQIETLH
jgi:hypothetical protein